MLTDPYHGVDWSRPGLRGNLHLHSTDSDGADAPAAMLAAYAAAGHGFAMLSDHDRWHAPAELAALGVPGLAILPGQEVTADGEHILQIGGAAGVACDPDRQRVLDAIAATGGLAVMNHPRWWHGREHCPLERLEALRGYHGIEVANAMIDELEGERWAFASWDRLLAGGRRVWGFANDDAHRLAHVGQAWNTAWPDRGDAAGVLAALAAGRFVASTGLAPDLVGVDGDAVEVRCPGAERILAIADGGVRIAAADGARLRVELPAQRRYVRFACLGRGERGAWTQPCFRA